MENRVLRLAGCEIRVHAWKKRYLFRRLCFYTRFFSFRKKVALLSVREYCRFSCERGQLQLPFNVDRSLHVCSLAPT